MNNNDIFRRLRFALQLDDRAAQALLKLGGCQADVDHVRAWRLDEKDPEWQACSSETLRAFLGGLILDRRGPPPQATPTRTPAVVPDPTRDIDNNELLKQLRIALSLRTEEVHALLKQGGSALSAGEAGALLRSPTARNFRRCGDQVVRQFLNGLAHRRTQS